MTDADQIFGTADIIETLAVEGEIRVKIGSAADGLGYASGLPMYGPDGYIGKPNAPSSNGDACQALYIVDGDGRIVVATRDNRYADKVGEMAPGDRAIVTDGEARVLIKREDDAVHIMSKNQVASKTMMWSMHGADGTIQVYNGGGCWIEMKGSVLTIGSSDGSSTTTLMVTPNGVQINGPNFMCCTAGGHLGLVAPPTPGFPGAPPVVGANSIVMGPTGMAGVGSAKWTVAP